MTRQCRSPHVQITKQLTICEAGTLCLSFRSLSLSFPVTHTHFPSHPHIISLLLMSLPDPNNIDTSKMSWLPWDKSDSADELRISLMGSLLGEYMNRWGKEFVVKHFTKITERALVRILLPATATETASSVWSAAIADHPMIGKALLTSALKIKLPEKNTPSSPASSSTTASAPSSSGTDEQQQQRPLRRHRSQRVPDAAAAASHCFYCHKCKRPPAVYRSHVLRDANGIVTCPLLRCYKCPVCHTNGGDYAHTITHCPLYNPAVRAEKLKFSLP